MTFKSSKIGAFLWKWFPLNEIVLCFAALFIFNNYLKHNNQVIRADGLGYYNYLPAVFIYKDLNFNFLDTLQTEFYNHKVDNQGIIRQVNGRSMNKYFAGTAMMQMPFFLGAHLVAKSSDQHAADGYSKIYQRSIYHAALVYALLGLMFLRFSLRNFGIHHWWIFWIQVAVLFASSLSNYIVMDASFSHAYSFALISVWSYLMLSFDPKKPHKIIWIALILGLIVLIRPINIIILAFVPFLLVLAGKKLQDFRLFFSHRKMLLLAILCFSIIVAIQPIIWYLQTGQFVVRSYGDESFNFLDPHLMDFLFSYRKGLFVYAPVFFVFLVLGSFFWIKMKSWRIFASFCIPFVILIYVLSSWWYWSYGASFGSRVMIDFYPLLALSAVPFFNRVHLLWKWFSIPIIAFAAYLALVQTYQYKHYIITWDDMTKEAYWTVFLKTQDKFRGYLWQEKWDPDWVKEEILSTENISLEHLLKEPLNLEFRITKNYQRLAVLITGNCSYSDGTNRFMVAIDDSLGNNQYYHEQAVFKSNAQENHTGPIQIVYFIKPLKIGSYSFISVILKEEEMSCSENFRIIIYGLE
jgi:hypothetical protein